MSDCCKRSAQGAMCGRTKLTTFAVELEVKK
jgi:hypothetical protein